MTADPSGVPSETPPAYYCRECPLTFPDGPSANAHHDATGHHQTWKLGSAFKASPALPREAGAPPTITDKLMDHAEYVVASLAAAVVGDETNGELADWFRPRFLADASQVIRALIVSHRELASRASVSPGGAPPTNEPSWMDVTPAVVQDWMQNRGYCEVAATGSVTLHDYDGDPGISFADATLALACDLADRFLSEVAGPDDVGEEECERQVQAWLKANDPSNADLVPETAAVSPVGEAGTRTHCKGCDRPDLCDTIARGTAPCGQNAGIDEAAAKVVNNQHDALLREVQDLKERLADPAFLYSGSPIPRKAIEARNVEIDQLRDRARTAEREAAELRAKLAWLGNHQGRIEPQVDNGGWVDRERETWHATLAGAIDRAMRASHPAAPQETGNG